MKPQVEFAPFGLSGTANMDETVLDVARRAGAPIGNSCGAIGVCARCRIIVIEGADALSPPTEIERRVAAQRGIPSEERFACQAVVRGNCRVTTSYWGG
jgi:ferredoxin, 2Fe-2S